MSQVILFAGLVARKTMRDRATAIMDMSVAVNAKQDKRNEFIKQLEKAGR